MMRKSKTCLGAKGPLTEYSSRIEAIEGADFARAEFGHDLAPYECEACGYFHLGRRDRAQGRTCAHCTGAEGRSKDIYATEEDARRMVKAKLSRGVSLKYYLCPVGKGWHLTKA